MQAINQPHPNTALVRPTKRPEQRPPEVEYTSIDFLKTQAQKGNPQPQGMEYESVERGVHGDIQRQPHPQPRRPNPPSQPPPNDSD